MIEFALSHTTQLLASQAWGCNPSTWEVERTP